MKEKIKIILTGFPKWFGLYLGICGLCFFNLFILEEAQQQVIFSTWSSKTAGDWQLVKQSIPLLEKINKTSSTINKCFGWINPLGYLAYRAYNQAEVMQIKSLNSLVFVNAPELYNGEIVNIPFIPNETEPNGEYFILKNGRISILSSKESLPQRITGRVQVTGNNIVIDMRSDSTNK
jgi:hypothetical protein